MRAWRFLQASIAALSPMKRPPCSMQRWLLAGQVRRSVADFAGTGPPPGVEGVKGPGWEAQATSDMRAKAKNALAQVDQLLSGKSQ